MDNDNIPTADSLLKPISSIISKHNLNHVNPNLLVDYILSLLRRINSIHKIVKKIEYFLGIEVAQDISTLLQNKYGTTIDNSQENLRIDISASRKQRRETASTQIVYVESTGITEDVKEDILDEILRLSNGSFVQKDRFIIFVAGLDPEQNSISRIYKIFKQFGRICAIEEDKENGVALIEYMKLAEAYHAIKKAPKMLGNQFLKVDFAVHPNPDAIASIEQDIKIARENFEQFDQAPRKSKNIQEKTIDVDNVLIEEMKTLRKRMHQNLLVMIKWNKKLAKPQMDAIKKLDEMIKSYEEVKQNLSEQNDEKNQQNANEQKEEVNQQNLSEQKEEVNQQNANEQKEEEIQQNLNEQKEEVNQQNEEEIQQNIS